MRQLLGESRAERGLILGDGELARCVAHNFGWEDGRRPDRGGRERIDSMETRDEGSGLVEVHDTVEAEIAS